MPNRIWGYATRLSHRLLGSLILPFVLLAPGAMAVLLTVAPLARAQPPRTTVAYQPMSSHGLSAGEPFEAWIVFDRSLNPVVAGYDLPAGATFRFVFPPAFTPQPNVGPEAVLLYGWPQRAAPIPFTVGLDPADPRTIMLQLAAPFPSDPPQRPGLKAVHLRMGPRNPSQAGEYPIIIQVSEAGPLSGNTQVIAHITSTPVPIIAAYNQLHEGQNEDWQELRPGSLAPLPLDLLVTVPGEPRASITLQMTPSSELVILSDGKRIGTITTRGVPLTLTPVPLGPGFARLGIVRIQAAAGGVPGQAVVEAQLVGGPPYTLHLAVVQS